MKKITNILGFFTIILAFFIDTSFALDSYKIDPSHTNLIWRANHFGFSKVSGKFTNIEGKILIDQRQPQNSSAEILIYTNSINTGFPKFDDHLKSLEFLDVATFPTASFKSTSVKTLSDSSAKVAGILTIKEIKKPITFDVKINKIGDNPLTKNKTVGMTISGIIKRSDYGINYGAPEIANEVQIEIESEAIYQGEVAKNTAENKSSENKDIADWQIIDNKSKLEFSASQNNSKINGAFKKFTGKINFDPNFLDKSSALIEVDTTSLDMNFAEALEALKNKAWLDIATFPKAIFKSEKFVATPGKDNYSAKGSLELKGKKVPITLNFNLKIINNKFALATGRVIIKRTDFNVGDKNINKANGVEDGVVVSFEVQAQKK